MKHKDTEVLLSERRCLVTHNPCGTDTRPVGRPCRCEPCIEWLIKELARVKAELAEAQREIGSLVEQLTNRPGDLEGAERELAEARHLIATNLEYEKLGTLRETMEQRDALKQGLRAAERRAERLVAALEEIRDDHAEHATLVGKDWSAALLWAQDIARAALRGEGGKP